jgi:hypothetical protein
MSSAFTKDPDDGGALPEPGERHVSTQRNLVTKNGLTMIDTEIAVLRDEMKQAEADGNREKIALAARDLRYWTARRETAEISLPDDDSGTIRFGMTVTLRDDHDKDRRRRRGRRQARHNFACLSHGNRLVRQTGRGICQRQWPRMGDCRGGRGGLSSQKGPHPRHLEQSVNAALTICAW